MLPRRAQLERALTQVPGFPRPDLRLEQVATPPGLAADVLYEAAVLGDITERTVVDLGCGTGRLAIGAALLHAANVHGYDTDPKALDIARKAAAGQGLDTVTFTEADVHTVDATADTVLSNPPFGAQQRHADRPFLAVAARTAPVAYTFHNARTREWVLDHIRNTLQARVTHQWDYRFPLPAAHAHHERPLDHIDVVVIRWES